MTRTDPVKINSITRYHDLKKKAGNTYCGVFHFHYYFPDLKIKFQYTVRIKHSLRTILSGLQTCCAFPITAPQLKPLPLVYLHVYTVSFFCLKIRPSNLGHKNPSNKKYCKWPLGLWDNKISFHNIAQLFISVLCSITFQRLLMSTCW